MRVVIYYIVALLVVLVDQWTKWKVVEAMEIGEKIPLIDGYLALLSHRNSGAAWGMLEGKMTFFYVITFLVVGGLLVYFHKEAKGDRLLSWSIMFIVGGAIGNFIDRVRLGEVVDFISVYIPVIQYNFPIFNVADAALTIGVLFMLIHTFIDDKNKEK